MVSSLMNVWRVPDLRRRLGFTFMIIALYRAGLVAARAGRQHQLAA